MQQGFTNLKAFLPILMLNNHRDVRLVAVARVMSQVK